MGKAHHTTGQHRASTQRLLSSEYPPSRGRQRWQPRPRNLGEDSCIKHTQDFTQVCTRWCSDFLWCSSFCSHWLGLQRAQLPHRTTTGFWFRKADIEICEFAFIIKSPLLSPRPAGRLANRERERVFTPPLDRLGRGSIHGSSEKTFYNFVYCYFFILLYL